jgi:hypothetical protein
MARAYTGGATALPQLQSPLGIEAKLGPRTDPGRLARLIKGVGWVCILAAVVCAGCQSYRAVDAAVIEGGPVVGMPRARIVNPELGEEALIIRESKLYDIVETPTRLSLRLTQLKLERLNSFDWQFNSSTSARFTFSFEECETGIRRTVQGTLFTYTGLTSIGRFGGRASEIGEAVGYLLAPGLRGGLR